MSLIKLLHLLINNVVIVFNEKVNRDMMLRQDGLRQSENLKNVILGRSHNFVEIYGMLLKITASFLFKAQIY
jgi:hypothetical protein